PSLPLPPKSVSWTSLPVTTRVIGRETVIPFSSTSTETVCAQPSYVNVLIARRPLRLTFQATCPASHCADQSPVPDGFWQPFSEHFTSVSQSANARASSLLDHG